MGAENLIEEPYLTAQELSLKTGLSVGFLLKQRQVGDLPYHKLGRNLRFKLSEFQVWAAKRKAR